jgi:hypothetical protein
MVGEARPREKLPMAFLIDDIFLLPLKAICENIKKAAEQDVEGQQKEVMAGLTELHQKLESAEIELQEFDRQETTLLDRLETLEKILNPEPRLTKVERLKKHFPEEFAPEPVKEQRIVKKNRRLGQTPTCFTGSWSRSEGWASSRPTDQQEEVS